jgi:hypothetical protein
MVKALRCRAALSPPAWVRVVSRTAMVATFVLSCAGSLTAGENDVHYWHQGVMPPGAIGNVQLQRGGPLPGFFQPVEIKAPTGVAISLAVGDTFDPPAAAPTRVGLLVGQVYRLRVTEIPLAPGVEVFPTIEVIDRVYAPAGDERRFAIPVELTEEDLRLAAQGKFVTRVIYVEDPSRAVPVATNRQGQNWFDVGPGRDPLAVADELGRPVAILRLGARLPDVGGRTDVNFTFGSPPFVRYPARVPVGHAPKVKQLPAPPKARPSASLPKREQS